MKHCTLLALVVAVTAGAQVEPVGDLNNDGLVGVEIWCTPQRFR